MKLDRILALLLCLVLLVGLLVPAVEAAQINPKKLEVGEPLWEAYVFLQARTQQELIKQDCLSELQSFAKKAYDQEDAVSAADWLHMALTIAVLDGDPTCFLKNKSKEPIDLLAENSYNWNKDARLADQKAETLTYALIALDARGYAVPKSAKYDRNDLLQFLLARQNENGSFDDDVVSTALALQALSPYRISSVEFLRGNGETEIVADAIEKGLEFLSHQQTPSAIFSPGECEASAQVVIALCSLGIDPKTDKRFERSGQSVLDGLMQFSLEDGSFAHTLEETEGNPMATVQAELALAAVERLEKGQRRLYDLRPELDKAVAQQLQTLNEALADGVPCRALVHEYLQIPAAERSYVAGWDIRVLDEDPANAYDLTQPGREYVSYAEETSVVWYLVIGAGTVIVVVLVLLRPKKRKQNPGR